MKLSTPLTLPHASFLTFSSNWSQISQMQLTSATSDHSSCWEAQGLSTRDGSWPVSAVAGESQLSHPFPWVLRDSRDARRALLNLNQEKWAWPPPSLREIFVSSSSSESQIKGWKSLKYGELDSVSSLSLTVTSFLEARSVWTVNHEA